MYLISFSWLTTVCGGFGCPAAVTWACRVQMRNTELTKSIVRQLNQRKLHSEARLSKANRGKSQTLIKQGADETVNPFCVISRFGGTRRPSAASHCLVCPLGVRHNQQIVTFHRWNESDFKYDAVITQVCVWQIWQYCYNNNHFCFVSFIDILTCSFYLLSVSFFSEASAASLLNPLPHHHVILKTNLPCEGVRPSPTAQSTRNHVPPLGQTLANHSKAAQVSVHWLSSTILDVLHVQAGLAGLECCVTVTRGTKRGRKETLF